MPEEVGAETTRPGSSTSGRSASSGAQVKGSTTRIGNYAVVDKVGEGGMGVVYKGYDETLDRHVAVKVLSEELSRNSEFVERFKREAKHAASLSHPNIVHIYAIGEKDNLYYYVMEYVAGESLEDVLRREGRIPIPKAVEYIIQAARGLESAARKGIVHRDIKPSNLMLSEDGFIKIADFGLSRLIKTERSLSATGFIIGTPLYMSPEQGKGNPTDHRADIYSLGATFYHLIAGEPPFDGETPVGILLKHITDPVPAVGEKNPDVTQKLAAVIRKMMEKDPEKRYQTYADLIADVEKTRPRELMLAPFWPRAFATLIDSLPFYVALSIFGVAAEFYPRHHVELACLGLFSFLVYCLVFALFASGGRQTLGMRNLNLMILTASGRPLVFSQAIRRCVVTQFVCLLLVVNFAVGGLALVALVIPMAIYHRFNRQKRSLQDVICKTIVVYSLS